jgi:glutaredoxin
MKARLLSKPGCHLCEDAERMLERLRKRYPHELELVDITTSSEMLQRYGERIPVLQLDGREYAAPLDERVLEQALRGGGG